MLRAAARPRMIVLLVLLLGAAAVCARLGVWQLDRAQLRGEQAERVAVAEREQAPPAALGDVLAPQASFSGDLVGERVEVEGRYEPEGQLLVPERALDGRTGYLVLTPLRVSGSGGDAGWTGPVPVLPVARGWVADAADPAALAVPDGAVRLTGYLQVSEASGSGDDVPGQTEAISSAELVNRWGGPIYTGYLVLASSEPAQPAGVALLPPPTLGGGSGLNVQNLAYAAQWWIFGAFAVLLWLRLVKDEAAGDVPEDEAGEPAVPDRVDASSEVPWSR
ncbi:SURF1 family protein [Cellulomonas fimi]|uniref:SURF1-like protein n=2 Tax=Cellulomonas fimi TaxID=1708 RepID=A0A7Y0QGC3_CELFI|nr:SURF1 family protein [Cellulomonas fimi]